MTLTDSETHWELYTKPQIEHIITKWQTLAGGSGHGFGQRPEFDCLNVADSSAKGKIIDWLKIKQWQLDKTIPTTGDTKCHR